jgi:hypothetical protein
LSDEKLARGFRPKALTALRKRLGHSRPLPFPPPQAGEG